MLQYIETVTEHFEGKKQSSGIFFVSFPTHYAILATMSECVCRVYDTEDVKKRHSNLIAFTDSAGKNEL